MAKTPNYNWTTYEDGVTVINFQTDISNFIKDVDTKIKGLDDRITANATNIGLLDSAININMIPSGTSILTWALSKPLTTHIFSTVSGVTDLPNSLAEWTAAVGLLINRYNQPYIVLFGAYGSVAVINRSSAGWGTWRINPAT